MFAPIRPRPIIPSCMLPAPSRVITPAPASIAASSVLQAGGHVRAEMDAQRAPAALGQHLEVAARLGRLDDAEGVLLARHRQVVRVVAGDLQEDAAVRPALVGLAGRVQEARPEAEAGGDALPVAHAMARSPAAPPRCAAFIST